MATQPELFDAVTTDLTKTILPHLALYLVAIKDRDLPKLLVQAATLHNIFCETQEILMDCLEAEQNPFLATFLDTLKENLVDQLQQLPGQYL